MYYNTYYLVGITTNGRITTFRKSLCRPEEIKRASERVIERAVGWGKKVTPVLVYVFACTFFFFCIQHTCVIAVISRHACTRYKKNPTSLDINPKFIKKRYIYIYTPSRENTRLSDRLFSSFLDFLDSVVHVIRHRVDTVM